VPDGVLAGITVTCTHRVDVLAVAQNFSGGWLPGDGDDCSQQPVLHASHLRDMAQLVLQWCPASMGWAQ
jgi:hypothetical protein